MKLATLVELRTAERRMGKVFGNQNGPVQKMLAENVKILDKLNDKRLGITVKDAAKLAPKAVELNLQIQELYDAYLELSRAVSEVLYRDVNLK